jgi:heme o synthase
MGYQADKHMKKKYLIILLKTGRWRLSIATAMATAGGALIAYPAIDIRLAAIFAGAMFFAMSVTWFNQIQERREDGLMARTMNRPLANNTLPVYCAIIWAGLCLTLSGLIFFACSGWPAIAILGAVILFYNGIYTPMKRRSPFALLLGAIAGAAPPVLGWICAGERILRITPLILFILFFVWQIPHFWLVEERNHLDYESAKLPLPWIYFGTRFYRYILSLWILAFCVALLALPAFGLVHSIVAQLFVLFISVVSVTGLAFHVFKTHASIQKMTGDKDIEHRRFDHLTNQAFNQSTIQPASVFINFSMATVCAILVAEKIFGG